jgi:hypothetical protein
MSELRVSGRATTEVESVSTYAPAVVVSVMSL